MQNEHRLLRMLGLVVLFGIGAGGSVLAQNTELFGDLWTTGIGGHGQATIDGVMDWQEWRNAAAVELLVNVPGGTTPATLYFMNDQNNLYIGLKFKRSALDPRSSLVIQLDTNNNGVLDAADDGVLFSQDAAVGFRDLFGSVWDTSLGGTNDGDGAVSNDGTYTTYELMHPLHTGDQYDISLGRHDTVGTIVSLRLLNSQNVIADTYFGNTNLFWANLSIR